jgi:hypothetical protein
LPVEQRRRDSPVKAAIEETPAQRIDPLGPSLQSQDREPRGRRILADGVPGLDEDKDAVLSPGTVNNVQKRARKSGAREQGKHR